MAERSLLTFAAYAIDRENEQLWLDNQPIRLTNKAFTVLRYLVEHPGQLVTKDALFAAVWPETIVSENTLTNCIGELRQALGDNPKAPQFIATVHRRGYRWLVSLHSALPVPSSNLQLPSPPPSDPQSPAPVLVGREAELTQLHQLFVKAMNSERQVVFVAGEAGIGKTALVDTFLHRLESGVQGLASQRSQRPEAKGQRQENQTPGSRPQTLDTGVWVACGQCVEQYGSGEAYLPVLEALGRFGRGPQKAHLFAVLYQYAPTWLVQLPALLGPAELEAVQRRVQGATRKRMLREITEAFDVLSAEHPVVLVLEDLHWSDPSTVELLTTVARRREPARLLVLGTYRAAELAVTNHPLKAVKHELVARGQATEVALSFLSPSAVREYVGQRLTEPKSADTLADIVYRRTDGQPLFMVQVTEYLAQQLGESVCTITDVRSLVIPQGLCEMIEAQLGRLTGEEQRILEVGSVRGAEFAVANAAVGISLSETAIEEICERLARRGQFIEDRGVTTWPDGTVSARYGFRHALYQDVLYTRLSEARRMRLHRLIGEQEEQAYGKRTSEIAAELAVHFEYGRDFHRAVQYLQTAAEKALRRNAYAEAISLLTHALELLKSWPETSARVQRELTLLFTLSAPLIATRGYTAPEVERAYSRARVLCRQVGDTPQLFPTLMGLLGFHFARAELRSARELGESCLTMVQRDPNPTRLMWTHYTLGQVLCCLGELALAKEHLEQGLALYQPQTHTRFVARAVQDPKVSCLCFLAVVLWLLGYATQALATIQEAESLARELAHPFSLAWALDYAARLHQFRREWQAAQEKAAGLMALAREQGFTHYLPGGTIRQGWALAEQGYGEEGIAQMRQGLDTYRATVAELERPYYHTLLAEAYGNIGHPEEGLSVLAEALAAVECTSEQYYEAELWRMKGELLLLKDEDRVQNDERKTKEKGQETLSVHHSSLIIRRSKEAEACFLKAIEIAQHQQAKSLELRATVSLARLWQQQGKQHEARQRLAEIYNWFTEGFDTVDLKEARAWLEALS